MGRAPCCDKANVKRGPWSPEEDATLKNYLHKHGTGGNWISLPQRAGLKRCGKSCRLRWLNYLRPDIKHGAFTEEEDNIIISLFYKMGSRWSVIAANLPGRTDNDVKNHWNTKLKKKLFGSNNNNNNNTINRFNPKIIDVPFNYNNIIYPNVFKASSSTSTPSPSPSPTTPTCIDSNYGHDRHPLYVPIPSFSSLLAQCTATASPMSLMPSYTAGLNDIDRPYSSSNHDSIASSNSTQYPVYGLNNNAGQQAQEEAGSSVSGSPSGVYGGSSLEEDPFLAELGFGLIQEVMMNPSCNYGEEEDIKPQVVGVGQSVAN